MAKKYENDPIHEAICEIRFVDQGLWDVTNVGLLYQELKTDFPVRKAVESLSLKFDIDKGFERTARPGDETRFMASDEKLYVSVRPYRVSVHCHSPYNGWDQYSVAISNTVSACKNVLGDLKIARLGLRYINRIEFGDSAVVLDRHFNYRPTLAEGMPGEFGSFVVGVQFVYKDSNDSLRLRMKDDSSQPGNAIVWLDLDYFTNTPDQVPFSQDAVEKWMVRAHDRVESVFEASITDETRDLFAAE